jgi:hypothetical protein
MGYAQQEPGLNDVLQICHHFGIKIGSHLSRKAIETSCQFLRGGTGFPRCRPFLFLIIF